MATNFATMKDAGAALQKIVRDLSKSARKELLVPIMEEASRPILDEAKANAPMRTGELRAAMNIKVSILSSGPLAKIGVTHGPDAPHAHLVENGTQPRAHKKTGKSTGSVRGTHFLRNAAQSKSPEAMRILVDRINRLVAGGGA